MKPTVMMKHVFLKIHFSRKYQKMNALHKIFLRLRWYSFFGSFLIYLPRSFEVKDLGTSSMNISAQLFTQ